MRTLCGSFALVAALTLAHTAASAQAPAPAWPPAAAGEADPLQWISVVLLEGGMTPDATAGAGDIPQAVRKALADVRDFLPFKQYRLYDAALVSPPRVMNTSANAWLRGDGTRVIEALLRLPHGTRALDSTRPFTIDFTLRGIAETADGKSHFSTARTLMGASVTMSLGETVVVGTSRLRGDTALIVLLTAVPAKR